MRIESSRKTKLIAVACAALMSCSQFVFAEAGSTRSGAIEPLQSMRASLKQGTRATRADLDKLRDLSALYVEASKFDDAEQVLMEEMALRQRIDADGLPESWLLLGIVYRKQGKYTIAERWLKRGLAELLEKHPSDKVRLSAAYNYLALFQNNIGQYEQSEANARKALMLSKEARLPEDFAAMHMVVLANALRQQGNFEEARTHLDAAIAILKKGGNPALLAAATNNLGALYFWLGEYQKSLTTLEEGLRLRCAAHGDDHPDVANSLLDLGCTEFRLGQTDSAIEHLSKSLEIRSKTLGPAHPETLFSKANLAVALNSIGKSKEALPLLKDAVIEGKKALGEHHPDLAQYEDDYANVLLAEKLPDQAQTYAADALRIRKLNFGARSREYAAGLRSMAHVESAQGNDDKALASLHQSVEVYKAAAQRADQDYADTLEELAGAYLERKNVAKARELYAEAIQKRAEGGPSVAYAVSLANFSEILTRLKQPDESWTMLNKAVDVIDSLPSTQKSNPDCVSIMDRYRRLTTGKPAS